MLTCFGPTEKDWEDIKFGVENGVDFYAVSFVKDAKVIHELKDYLKGNVRFIYASHGYLCWETRTQLMYCALFIPRC
jgi:hypothetical protein